MDTQCSVRYRSCRSLFNDFHHGLLGVRVERDRVGKKRDRTIRISLATDRPLRPTGLSYEEGETMVIEIMRQREPMTVQVTVPERDDNFFWRRNGRF